MALHNVHERVIDAPAEVVGALLDRLAGDDDPLWPDRWLPIRFDRPLEVGADGGHGDVRYRVSAYEPGRRVRFKFHRPTGIDGYHELTVEPIDAGRCRMRHVLEGQPRGAMRLLVPLVVEQLHDAVLEDLLDNAERAATGEIAEPARWSAWVRFWRRVTELPRPRAVPIPEGARLARTAFNPVAFSDAWQAPLLRSAPTDPQFWAEAIFGHAARRRGVLLRLRNRLAPLIGVEPADPREAFAVVDRSAGEVLLGSDASHLDFRASILVEDGTLTVSTVVRIHNRRGQLYMAIVRLFHPAIVRRMVRGALRRLDVSGPETDDPAQAGPSRQAPSGASRSAPSAATPTSPL